MFYVYSTNLSSTIVRFEQSS